MSYLSGMFACHITYGFPLTLFILCLPCSLCSIVQPLDLGVLKDPSWRFYSLQSSWGLKASEMTSQLNDNKKRFHPNMASITSLRCKPTASICSGTEPCLPFSQQVPLPLCSSVCVLAGSVSENSRWGGSRVSLAWRRQRLWAQWSVPLHHAGSQSGPCGAMRGEGSPQDEVSFHCGARERSQENSCCMHVLSDSPCLW